MEIVKTKPEYSRPRCEICLKWEYYDSVRRYCTQCDANRLKINNAAGRMWAAFGTFLFYKRRMIITFSIANDILTAALLVNFFYKVSHSLEITLRICACLTMIFNIILSYTFFNYSKYIRTKRKIIVINSMVTAFLSSYYLFRGAFDEGSPIKPAFLFAIFLWIGSWTAVQLIGNETR